jgi:ribosomal protein S18 acetylase RimI-like enzyme
MIIRECRIEDIKELSNVALSTAMAGKDGNSYFHNKDLISQYYCEPYIRFDAQYCFAVEEDNVCCGYTVGVIDSTEFFKWFNDVWLVKLRAQYKNCKSISEEEDRILDLIKEDVEPSDYFEQYPAHLHINLLDTMQGKSIGTRLISTLLQKLADDNIKGVHLGVQIDNNKAIGFYKHLGFKVIEEKPWGYVMGKALSIGKAQNSN